MRSPLIFNGADAQLLTANDLIRSDGTLYAFDPSSGFYFYDDFDNSAATGQSWAAVNAGTGAQQAQVAVAAGEHGVISINAGTTSTGRSGLVRGTTTLLLGNGAYMVKTRFRFSALCTTNDQSIARVGAQDSTTTSDNTDGIYAEYNNAASGDYLILKTASNGSRTTTVLDGTSGNATVAITANTWIKWVAIVNAAGTQVDFYVNDVFVKSHTTNIPTGAGRQCGGVLGMWHSSYTSVPRQMEVDYFMHIGKNTTRR